MNLCIQNGIRTQYDFVETPNSFLNLFDLIFWVNAKLFIIRYTNLHDVDELEMNWYARDFAISLLMSFKWSSICPWQINIFLLLYINSLTGEATETVVRRLQLVFGLLIVAWYFYKTGEVFESLNT